MSENSNIEWCDHTYNDWEGCQKAGPGCDNCYAEARNARFAKGIAINWGPGSLRRRTSEANWQLPYRWNRNHDKFFAQHGRRQRVFCSSLSDVFDNAVDPQWRVELFTLIKQTPHLDWLLLTKRIGNAGIMLANVRLQAEEYIDPFPWPNVWLGATICNQEEADRDIPKLRAVPAAKRFLSMEPLLGPVDIREHLWPVHASWPAKYRSSQDALADGAKVTYRRQALISKTWADSLVNWVIVGGESGPNARPMHPDWARSLRDQCVKAGVPFLFKQWGEWVDADNGPDDDSAYGGKPDCWAHIEGGHHSGEMGVDFFSTYPMYRVGKKAAGRLLDGRTWDEVPS